MLGGSITLIWMAGRVRLFRHSVGIESRGVPVALLTFYVPGS